MTGITSALGVAVIGPIHAGQPLFAAQNLAEQGLAKLSINPGARCHYLLDLLERRTRDLASSRGDKGKTQALQARNTALEQVLRVLVNAPAQDWPDLRSRLITVLDEIKLSLKQANQQPSQGVLANLDALQRDGNSLTVPLNELAKLFDLEKTASGQASDPASQPNGTAQPNTGTGRVVQFQDGSNGAKHAFFPLTGKHAALDCGACHGGVYAGTTKECAACHSAQKPAKHYDGECGKCHNISNWDHEGGKDSGGDE